MRSLLIIVCACICSAIRAEDGPVFWYRVIVAQPQSQEAATYTYYGSSRLDAAAMASAIEQRRTLTLGTLLAWHKDGATLWSEYDTSSQGSVLIPADRIIVVMPLAGDPRQRAGKSPATGREAPKTDDGKAQPKL